MHEEVREWHPTTGITAPCARVDMSETEGNLVLLLVFSDVVDGEQRNLQLRFGRVVAVMSHEESAHPWNDSQQAQPKLAGRWSDYTFPCLEVKGSRWLSSFGESGLFGRGECHHFQVVTLEKTVDVAAVHEPTAEWLAV